MTKGTLPPQAFSSKDMSQALKWLEGQPSHIKNMAKTTEALMSLYRQATIYKEEFYDKYPPVSEERFRKDLNDIASQLNDFSEPQKATTKSSQVSPLSYDENTSEKAQFIESNVPEKKAPPKPVGVYDEQTSQRLQEVQNKLNLSSENEALRMLVSLGYERFLKL